MLMEKPTLTGEGPVSSPITEKKAGIAWRKLCASLQQFGRQQERRLVVTKPSESHLIFRPDRGRCTVALTLQETLVTREMGDVRDTILFVKIKSNSVAYQMGGNLYSAVRLVLELLRQYPDYGRSNPQATTLAEKKTSAAKDQNTPEQIVRVLRQLNLVMAKGVSPADACKEAGIAESAYHRWRREYGGLDMRQAKWIMKLEKENTKLKELVAEFYVLKQMLRETAANPLHKGDPL